jgi:Cu/Ag efflux protein CusF
MSPPTHSQQTLSPSEWLDRYDREHDVAIGRPHHVHARGLVLKVDVGPATVTILSDQLAGPDNAVLMPAMIMVFPVTNRKIVQGLQPRDEVHFEAARLGNKVVITNIRKLP